MTYGTLVITDPGNGRGAAGALPRAGEVKAYASIASGAMSNFEMPRAA
jgi:hypothetical protein